MCWQQELRTGRFTKFDSILELGNLYSIWDSNESGTYFTTTSVAQLPKGLRDLLNHTNCTALVHSKILLCASNVNFGDLADQILALPEILITGAGVSSSIASAASGEIYISNALIPGQASGYATELLLKKC